MNAIHPARLWCKSLWLRGVLSLDKKRLPFSKKYFKRDLWIGSVYAMFLVTVSCALVAGLWMSVQLHAEWPRWAQIGVVLGSKNHMWVIYFMLSYFGLAWGYFTLKICKPQEVDPSTKTQFKDWLKDQPEHLQKLSPIHLSKGNVESLRKLAEIEEERLWIKNQKEKKILIDIVESSSSQKPNATPRRM